MPGWGHSVGPTLGSVLNRFGGATGCSCTAGCGMRTPSACVSCSCASTPCRWVRRGSPACPRPALPDDAPRHLPASGSGALAGNPFGLDRAALAADLGFASVMPNSMYGVADRDFVVRPPPCSRDACPLVWPTCTWADARCPGRVLVLVHVDDGPHQPLRRGLGRLQHRRVWLCRPGRRIQVCTGETRQNRANRAPQGKAHKTGHHRATQGKHITKVNGQFPSLLACYWQRIPIPGNCLFLHA